MLPRGWTSRPLAAPLVNAADGRALQPGGLVDDSYWNGQGHESPSGCAATLSGMGASAVVEMGPASAFVAGIRDSWPETGPGGEHQSPLMLNLGESPDGAAPEPGAAFVEAVAKAYEACLNVDFNGLFAGELRRRAPLPGYPFQRRRHWVDAPRCRACGLIGCFQSPSASSGQAKPLILSLSKDGRFSVSAAPGWQVPTTP